MLVEKQEKLKVTNRFQGKGTIEIEHLLTKSLLPENISMYAKVTLPPNTSIGYHMHNKDNESYHIISGIAKYTTQKGTIFLYPGDTTFTSDQDYHGIENTGDEPLQFIAIITKEK